MTGKISLPDLKEALNYDPNTGVFRWKKRASQMMPGSVAGTDEYGYRAILINGVRYRAHRLAWFYMTGKWPKKEIDHINRDRGDNRWCNLRQVDKSINQQNRECANSNNRSGLLGVKRLRNGKYAARIQANKKQHHIGYYDNAEDAHQAYLEKKRELHGGCTI